MLTMAKFVRTGVNSNVTLLTGLSLRDGGRGFSPATMNVAHQKKSLAV